MLGNKKQFTSIKTFDENRLFKIGIIECNKTCLIQNNLLEKVEITNNQ